MLTRGLLMLLSIEHLGLEDWNRVTSLIIVGLNSIFYSYSTPLALDTEVMLFIQSISNMSLLTYLNKLQQILTLTIESVEAESDFLEDLVRLIDVFWRVNQSKPIDDRISAKAF